MSTENESKIDNQFIIKREKDNKEKLYRRRVAEARHLLMKQISFNLDDFSDAWESLVDKDGVIVKPITWVSEMTAVGNGLASLDDMDFKYSPRITLEDGYIMSKSWIFKDLKFCKMVRGYFSRARVGDKVVVTDVITKPRQNRDGSVFRTSRPDGSKGNFIWDTIFRFRLEDEKKKVHTEPKSNEGWTKVSRKHKRNNKYNGKYKNKI